MSSHTIKCQASFHRLLSFDRLFRQHYLKSVNLLFSSGLLNAHVKNLRMKVIVTCRLFKNTFLHSLLWDEYKKTENLLYKYKIFWTGKTAHIHNWTNTVQYISGSENNKAISFEYVLKLMWMLFPMLLNNLSSPQLQFQFWKLEYVQLLSEVVE